MSSTRDEYTDVIMKILEDHIMAPEAIHDYVQRDAAELNFSEMKLILDEMKENKVVLQLPGGDYILQSNLDRMNKQKESLKARFPKTSLSRGSHEFKGLSKSRSQSRSKSPGKSESISAFNGQCAARIISQPKSEITSMNQERVNTMDLIMDLMPGVYRALILKVLVDYIIPEEEIVNISFIQNVVIPINLPAFKKILNEMIRNGEVIELPGENYMLQNMLDEINRKRKSIIRKHQSRSSRKLDPSRSSTISISLRKSASPRSRSKSKSQKKLIRLKKSSVKFGIRSRSALKTQKKSMSPTVTRNKRKTKNTHLVTLCSSSSCQNLE